MLQKQFHVLYYSFGEPPHIIMVGMRNYYFRYLHFYTIVHAFPYLEKYSGIQQHYNTKELVIPLTNPHANIGIQSSIPVEALLSPAAVARPTSERPNGDWRQG